MAGSGTAAFAALCWLSRAHFRIHLPIELYVMIIANVHLYLNKYP